MFCVNCGANLPDGALFCTVCGAKVHAAPVLPQNVCRKCGAVLKSDSRFCLICGTPVMETGGGAINGMPENATYSAPMPGKQPKYTPPASEPGKPLPTTKVGERGKAAAAAFAVTAVVAALLFLCFCRPGLLLKFFEKDGGQKTESVVSKEEKKDTVKKESTKKEEKTEENKKESEGIDLAEIEALKEEQFEDKNRIVLNRYSPGSADSFALTLGYDSSYDWSIKDPGSDRVVIRSEEMEIEVTLDIAVRDTEDWEITKGKHLDDRDYGELNLSNGMEGYYYQVSSAIANTGITGTVNLGSSYRGLDKELSDKKNNILTFILAGWDYENTEFELEFLENVFKPILEEAVTEPLTKAP